MHLDLETSTLYLLTHHSGKRLYSASSPTASFVYGNQVTLAPTSLRGLTWDITITCLKKQLEQWNVWPQLLVTRSTKRYCSLSQDLDIIFLLLSKLHGPGSQTTLPKDTFYSSCIYNSAMETLPLSFHLNSHLFLKPALPELHHSSTYPVEYGIVTLVSILLS